MKNLNIRCESMLGTSHSWAVTMRNLLKNFHNLDNNLYLKTINGRTLFPEEWKPFLRDIKDPDIDISYTLPRNFEHRFKKNAKLLCHAYHLNSKYENWCVRSITIYEMANQVLPKELPGNISDW